MKKVTDFGQPILNQKRLIVTLFLLIVSSWSFNNSFADEPIVIISEGEYVMGAGESMEVSEEKAKKAAIQKAAEQAGAYVKSYTKVKNLSLESDVIEVIANHSMKVEVIDKKKSIVGNIDAIKFYVKIRAAMTEDEIEANLKKVREDSSIVDAYNRLKQEFERQNKEVERLKKQLELATGGDKQKIAKLISEEEKRYKANLWIERAEQLLGEEQLKAYEKALELNPGMPQAYLGIARNLQLWKGDLESLKEALENLNYAISLDENFGEAYALRADIRLQIKSKTESEGSSLEEDNKSYYRKILEDINRAFALNVSNKNKLYNLRLSVYINELNDAMYEQMRADNYNPEIIENHFNKVMNEIDMVSSLCAEGYGDLHFFTRGECLSRYYRLRANECQNVILYYQRMGDPDKEKEFTLLRDKFRQKSVEVEKQEESGEEKEKRMVEKLEKPVEAFNQTEFGKIYYEVYGDLLMGIRGGWKEKVMGITFRDVSQKSPEEQEKIFKQIDSRIKKKISSGKASAEEYIFMSKNEGNRKLSEEYFKKGIELFEKRNPVGIDALLLVEFYFDRAVFQDDINFSLKYLDKAKAIVDRNLPQAQKALGLNEYIEISNEFRNELYSKIEAAVSDSKSDAAEIIKSFRFSRLNKQQAEAYFCWNFASEISSKKAEIYERLGLLAKAREEYLYLCETFKDKDACKNAERLK